MKIRLSYPNAQDTHYLVNAAQLMKLVDADDLACRKSEEIRDSFHEHWFIESKGPAYEFIPPAICFSKAGVLKFINGRHRTLVLSRHMDNIPVAIASLERSLIPKSEWEVCRRQIEEITLRIVDQDDVIEFPDLPIEYLGYDHNIGK